MPKLSELIPTCIGEVEPGDATCDGDTKAKGDDREPCSWRDRCRGFQLHLAATGETPGARIQLVKLSGQVKRRSGLDQTAAPVGMSHAQFTRFCRTALQRYAPRGRPGDSRQASAAKKAGRGTSVGARRAAEPKGVPRRTASERDLIMKARRVAFRAYRDVFIQRLIAELPPIRQRARRLILPGDIHLKTDWERHRCTLYVRDGLHDRGLVRIQYMPSISALNVWVGTDKRRFASVISRRTLVKLDPQPTSARNFPIVIRGAGDEAVSLVAESLGRLINRGIIVMPNLIGEASGGARRGS